MVARTNRGQHTVYDALDRSSAAAPAPRPSGTAITRLDAIEIWIARWLRVSRKELVQRYGCDSRRLYEIWWGEKFTESRGEAERIFAERYPALVDRTVFGYRRISRPTVPEGQLDLFAKAVSTPGTHKLIVEQLKNKDRQE